ncbi:MAG: lysylphosphatidylglycerol synthase transmembrane domain-containing protein [Ginsengibacter sp.]
MSKEQIIQFKESLKHANYWLIIPVIIMSLLSHLSRAMRWKLLMRPMGYLPKTSTTFFTIMTGYLVNTFLPRAGEILKCSLLSKYAKIPMNKLIGTVLVERAFDLICYLALILITIIIQINFVSQYVKTKLSGLVSNKHGMPPWIKLVVFISIVIIVIAIIKWIFKKYELHPYIVSIKGFHIGLKEGFRTITRLKKRRLFLAHTFFIWLMYLLEIYIGFFALEATSNLNIIHACSVLSLATLGMIVSPGGIGAFPLAVQEVLLLYNIDNVSFGWLIWGISTAIIIVAGIICFTLLIYQKKVIYEDIPATGVKDI